MKTKRTFLITKRCFDSFFAFTGLLIFSIPVLLIGVLIKLTSKGTIIHWSYRMGKNNKVFRMAKIRTIKKVTNIQCTDAFQKKEKDIVFLGRFLRESGLDELPQLYNILIGEMSFVGPRPVLCDERDLIQERIINGIYSILPGLTGLAQIKGRKELSIRQKVYYDRIYLQKMTLLLDFKIIFSTISYLIKENFIFKRKKVPEKKLIANRIMN